jgi:hypothetical protein
LPRRPRTTQPPAPPAKPRNRRLLFKSAALLLGLGVVVGGLIALGEHAREQLRGHERYTISFAEVECLPPPPYQPRGDFLDEVRYLSRLPRGLQLLDPDLGRRLAEGFAQHPWVKKVERVEVSGRQVRVRLVYRRPALAVRLKDRLRVVDEEGVLLPKGAPVEGLPVFAGAAPQPAGPAGRRWGDAAVEEAARRGGQSPADARSTLKP